MDILLLLVGLGLILGGANFLTDGSAAVAQRFRVPEFIIGLTIVAVGTSSDSFMFFAIARNAPLSWNSPGSTSTCAILSSGEAFGFGRVRCGRLETFAAASSTLVSRPSCEGAPVERATFGSVFAWLAPACEGVTLDVPLAVFGAPFFSNSSRHSASTEFGSSLYLSLIHI